MGTRRGRDGAVPGAVIGCDGADYAVRAGAANHQPGAPAIQPAATTGGVESIESILEQLLNSLGLNPNGVPVLGLDGGTILGQYIEQSLGGGYPVNLAQLFVDFIGYTEVAAESQLIATAAASSGDGHGGGAPQTFSVSGATPYVSTHVTANMGGAGRLGRFSAPTWTTQPWNLEGRAPTVSVATPTTQRYQTGILCRPQSRSPPPAAAHNARSAKTPNTGMCRKWCRRDTPQLDRPRGGDYLALR
ncbi:hypothetical protein MBOT_19890 [Mycobacterium botniense]|uniref:Uncharacterized protein n=1 Tax=Mycobacterium botniense TaxID=84962 RepID=A0A7I9XXU5_9MYCO|nr:hypothetical protein [Mycobacterium botniense]GFG74624.1 hypothetical protein MBOT_19890 [Mycobacterium botniense]